LLQFSTAMTSHSLGSRRRATCITAPSGHLTEVGTRAAGSSGVGLQDQFRDAGAERDGGALTDRVPVGIERVPRELQRERVVDHVEVACQILGAQLLDHVVDGALAVESYVAGRLDDLVDLA